MSFYICRRLHATLAMHADVESGAVFKLQYWCAVQATLAPGSAPVLDIIFLTASIDPAIK